MDHKIVFLDRDGVINHDYGYVYRPEDFHFIPFAIDAMRILNEKNYRIVIVTNQSGIARGYFTERQYLDLDVWLRGQLASAKVEIEDILYCPHHPDGIVPEYSKKCDCRKPMNGMIEKFYNISHFCRTKSVLVGDRVTDIECAVKSKIGTRYLLDSEDKLKNIDNPYYIHAKSLYHVACMLNK